jgi:hypothetical protein
MNGRVGAAKVGDKGGDQVLAFDEPAEDTEHRQYPEHRSEQRG